VLGGGLWLDSKSPPWFSAFVGLLEDVVRWQVSLHGRCCPDDGRSTAEPLKSAASRRVDFISSAVGGACRRRFFDGTPVATPLDILEESIYGLLDDAPELVAILG